MLKTQIARALSSATTTHIFHGASGNRCAISRMNTFAHTHLVPYRGIHDCFEHKSLLLQFNANVANFLRSHSKMDTATQLMLVSIVTGTSQIKFQHISDITSSMSTFSVCMAPLLLLLSLESPGRVPLNLDNKCSLANIDADETTCKTTQHNGQRTKHTYSHYRLCHHCVWHHEHAQ